jgi:hypothetical protein
MAAIPDLMTVARHRQLPAAFGAGCLSIAEILATRI